jgi:hypothetical protein
MENPDLVFSEPYEPVFIGSFRSGTTLLVNLLGLHPDLMPWFETKAFCEALRWLRVMRLPEIHDEEARLARPAKIQGFHADAVAERMIWDFYETQARIKRDIASGKAVGERYPIGHDVALYSPEEAEVCVREWLSSIGNERNYSIIARATGHLISKLGDRQMSLGGKPRWINKTPEITRFASELRACLGPCRIIFLIRDGIQVVHSAAKLGWAESRDIAAWWKAMIQMTRAGATEDPERYLEVRYEELVDQPASQVDRVLEFLGMDPCGSVLLNEYLSILGISELTEASTGAIKTPQSADNLRGVEGLIDWEFNRELGY